MPASTPAPGLRERKKQERRDRILEAIRTLLRENPEQTPTVERIAALADLSPATVFNLLGPRERQWQALCEDFRRDLSGRYDLDPYDDPREQAHHVVVETAELFIADAAVTRYLLNNWGRSVALLGENPIPPLRATLRHGQESGMLRSDLQVEALAGHIATTSSGALRLWAAGEISDAEFRKRVRFAVDVAFVAGASEDWVGELSLPLRREKGLS